MSYRLTRKVYKQGTSLVVTLPTIWVEAAGIKADPSVRLAVADVPVEHPLVWTEQMMPVFPVVRVANVDQAISLALSSKPAWSAPMARPSSGWSRAARPTPCCAPASTAIR